MLFEDKHMVNFNMKMSLIFFFFIVLEHSWHNTSDFSKQTQSNALLSEATKVVQNSSSVPMLRSPSVECSNGVRVVDPFREPRQPTEHIKCQE